MVTFGQIGAALAVLLSLAALAYAVKTGKLRGFWNDRDGLTITDFLAILFTSSYFVVSWVMVRKVLGGTLTDKDVTFFEVYSWGMWTILGGYFVDRTASRLGDILPRRRQKAAQPEEYPTEGSNAP